MDLLIDFDLLFPISERGQFYGFSFGELGFNAIISLTNIAEIVLRRLLGKR